MTDLAVLGIKIDASSADDAASKLDKLTVAGARAETSVDKLGDQAQQAGAQFKTASQQAAEMAAEAQRMAGAASASGRGMTTASGAGKMLSMQLSQVAQQAAAGGNVLQALAIQLPDIAMGMGAAGASAGRFAAFLGGPWGIAIASAVSVAVAFAPKLLGIGEAADKAKGPVDALTESINRLAEAQGRVGDIGNAATRIIQLQGELNKLDNEAGGNRAGSLERAARRKELNEQIATTQRAIDLQKIVNNTQERTEAAADAAAEAQKKRNEAVAEAERLAKAAAADAKREFEQRVKSAQDYAQSMEDLAAKFGKSAIEIQRMEVAARAAAAPTGELARRIREAGAALETLQINKAVEEFDRMIIAIYDEIELSGMVGKARELRALALEKDAKMAEWAAKGLTELDNRWAQYAAARMAGIEQKSALDHDAKAASKLAGELERVNRQLSDMIGALQGMGGFAGTLGGILGGIQTGNFSSLGPAGVLLNIGLNQKDYSKQADLIADRISDVFRVSGPFAKTLSTVLQGAGTGAMVGAALGGSKESQIGSAIGGAAGQAIGSSIAALGSAGGPIGAVVGAIAGSLLGGLLTQAKSKANVIIGDTGGAGVSGTFGKTGGEYTTAANSLSTAVIDNLKRLADAIGATATGIFKLSIGVRNGNFVVNPTGGGTKASMGAFNFGKDSEAAIKFAIETAIAQGAFDGLSEGWKNFLLRDGNNIEEQLTKLASLKGAYDELEQRKDPQAYALKELDAQFDILKHTALRAGDDLVKIEELYQLKRKDIIERTTGEASNALELERQKRQYEIQIMQLTGDTVGALTAARAMEKEQANASLHELMDRIYALQDEAAATAASAEAARQAAAAQEQAADRMAALQERLLRAQGDEAGLTAFQRARELSEALSDAERAMLGQIHAAEDTAKAAAAAAAAADELRRQQEEAAREAEALARQKSDLEIQLLRAQGKEEQALAQERARALSALPASLHALQKMVWAEQDLTRAREEARSVLADAYARESKALQDTIDKFSGLRDELAGFRKSLFTGAGFDDFATLQRRFLQTSALANTGQEQALRDLPGVAKEFLDAAQGRSASLADYQMQVAQVARAVDQAMGAADDVVDYNELQLEALDRSVEGLIDLKEEVVSVREAIDRLNDRMAEADENNQAGQIAIAQNTGAVAKVFRRNDAGTGIAVVVQD